MVMCPDESATSDARARIESVLRDEPIRTVVQPIVDLRTGVVRSAESFTRFLDVPYRSPDVWFAEASAVGLGCEMQELALRRGLETLQVVPPTISVGFNVSWDMLVSGQVSALFAGAGVATDRVCVEISEHREVSSYEEARREVAALRELGADVTIDRVGSGLSSLHQVIELAPGAIKLDRYFICGLDRDAARRAMVEAFAHFGSRTGIDLIAEGLETAAELEAARRLGIRYGQGYVIARPDAPESMPAEYPEIGRRAGD